MKRFFVMAPVFLIAGAGSGFVACSSSSGGAITPAADSGQHDAGEHDSAAPENDTGTSPDMGTTPDTGIDAASGDAGDVTLTVKNYKAWCSVTINGGTASKAASITDSVPAGSTATIVATPLASFKIGADPWFGTDQDDGGAAPGVDQGEGGAETTTATVTVTATHDCVSVCCEHATGNGGCPATNPCP
jgi:hypothetical protein